MGSLSEDVTEKLVSAQVARSVIQTAARWLNANPAVADVVVSLTGSNKGLMAAALLVKWLASKIAGHAPPDTCPALETLPIETAPELACTLAVAERLTGAEPGRHVKGVSGRLEVVRAERRVGLGITRRDGTPHPLLLLTSGTDGLPSWVTKDLPVVPQTLVVGQAATTFPTSPQTNAQLTVPIGEHRPGRSVAHHRYNAGSIGAYVRVYDEQTDRDILGFVSAAHVLSNMGRADPQDRILSPGYPDCERDGKYTYGYLYRWHELIHHTSQTEPDLVVNTTDIAFGSLRDSSTPAINQVLDPEDPKSNLVKVSDYMSLTDIRDHTFQDVFLVGRTTPFAQGRLIGTDIQEFPIKMPNGRTYMFAHLALIESSAPHRRFSQAGDSGALVYAVRGSRCRAVGFIVGGNESYNYITPAATCLQAMEASLV
jgi:hypothetical protein